METPELNPTSPQQVRVPAPKYKCGACWTTDHFGTLWMYFGFKHLESLWICPSCQPNWVDHYVRLQERGL